VPGLAVHVVCREQPLAHRSQHPHPCPDIPKYVLSLCLCSCSQLSQADEGQRQHYNDGYFQSPYDPFLTPTPNPYTQHPVSPPPDHYSILSPPTHYAATPDPYAARPGPSPHPPPTHYVPSPPPPPPFQYPPQAPPPPQTHSYAQNYGPSYEEEQGDHDPGDIPLLRREPSVSSYVNVDLPIPGAFEDHPGSNIRYGRIPQRIPRRYKTLKKVE